MENGEAHPVLIIQALGLGGAAEAGDAAEAEAAEAQAAAEAEEAAEAAEAAGLIQARAKAAFLRVPLRHFSKKGGRCWCWWAGANMQGV